MRNTILNAVAIMLLAFAASCGNSPKDAPAETAVDTPGTARTQDAAQTAPPIVSLTREVKFCSTTTDEPCKPKNYCDNSICRSRIMKSHKIDKKDFRRYREYYNGKKLYRGKTIAAADIEKALASSVCSTGYILLYDSTKKIGNRDITFVFDKMPGNALYYSKYSTALFNAVLMLKNKEKPKFFEFYKARYPQTAFDTCDLIIFKAYNDSGKQVYCGGLNGINP